MIVLGTDFHGPRCLRCGTTCADGLEEHPVCRYPRSQGALRRMFRRMIPKVSRKIERRNLRIPGWQQIRDDLIATRRPW